MVTKEVEVIKEVEVVKEVEVEKVVEVEVTAEAAPLPYEGVEINVLTFTGPQIAEPPWATAKIEKDKAAPAWLMVPVANNTPLSPANAPSQA